MNCSCRAVHKTLLAAGTCITGHTEPPHRRCQWTWEDSLVDLEDPVQHTPAVSGCNSSMIISNDTNTCMTYTKWMSLLLGNVFVV